MTDEDLMQAVRAGDFEALGELFERHHRRVYGYLRGRGLTPAVAEDVVQEAFTRLLRYRRSYHDGARFLPWFLTIVRRCSVPRRQRPEPVSEEVLSRLEEAAVPGDLALRRVETRELHSALEQLPEAQREALLLSYFEELSSTEVAEILGARAGAVRVRVHRAVNRLREILVKETVR